MPVLVGGAPVPPPERAWARAMLRPAEGQGACLPGFGPWSVQHAWRQGLCSSEQIARSQEMSMLAAASLSRGIIRHEGAWEE